MIKNQNIFIFLLICMNSFGQSIDIHEQSSLWGFLNEQKKSQIGLRIIPTLSSNVPISQKWNLDAEMSCQATQWWQFDQWKNSSSDNKLKPYRVWTRLTSDQFEIRLGLQKLNFGSARILRPLMWFDQIDARDPLQLTDGVYGLLMKYYFINNANFWFWGLLGNADPKGWEFKGTHKRKPEFGGRIQLPCGPGECAGTVHYRSLDLSNATESRFAIDGRWDIEIGFWFEFAMTQQNWKAGSLKYQKMGTLGADYTFGIGNGLYGQAEHFIFQISKDWDTHWLTQKFTAVSMNYSFGLLDNLTTMVYHDWNENSWYRFLNWQRTYDQWMVHLIGFWNPDQMRLIQFQSDQSLFMGKGIQLMIVFNH